MSSYQFLASDHPFEKLENPFLERLSIREALERNMDIPDFMLENSDMDPEEKIFLLCDTEEHLTSAKNLEIFSLWLDEKDPPQRMEVTLDCLNLSHLSFLDLSEGYQGPRCLHVINTHPALKES